MARSPDNNTSLTHLYGLAGLIPGVIGLAVAVKASAPWSEYVVFGSGWIVAFVYAAMVVKAFNRARTDGEEVGRLMEKVEALSLELSNRNSTLDYLAGLLVGRTAIPRAAPAAAPAPAPAPAAAAEDNSKENR